MKVEQANISNLNELAPLFDKYRVFYGQESNLNAALTFLEERFTKNESVVFISYKNEIATGFLQLYYSFSSVNLKPTLILNDLYVSKKFRQQNIGTTLLKHAQAYCKKNGFLGLVLETAVDNPAQKLYEKLGWEKDSHCFHYFWHA